MAQRYASTASRYRGLEATKRQITLEAEEAARDIGVIFGNFETTATELAKNNTGSAGDRIREAGKKIQEAARTKVQETMDKCANMADQAPRADQDELARHTTSLFSRCFGLVGQILEGVRDIISKVVQALWETVKAVTQAAWRVMKKISFC